LIVVCTRCHQCCRHLFVTAAAVAAIAIINPAAVATADATAVTAVFTVANTVVTVVVAISTAVAANNNSNGSIFTFLGWLWVVA
jgi:hypothetical protein